METRRPQHSTTPTLHPSTPWGSGRNILPIKSHASPSRSSGVRFLLSAFCFLLSVLPAPAAPDAAAIAARLEPIRARHHLPALAGALLTHTGLVAVAATGVRKAGADAPATADDCWHLGSDTKAMTAVLLGRLVDEGRLQWTKTLAEIFPELADGMQPEFRAVTVAHLLSHRAGLPHNLRWSKFSHHGTLPEQRLAALQEATARKPESKPGARYAYSNTGYVLAGAVLERAGGASWEEQIEAKLFRPLGMTGAGFGGTGTPGRLDQPWGHTAGAKPVGGNGPAQDNPPVIRPAGGVHAPLADWAKFVADVLRGARGEPSLLLKPETVRALRTPPFGGDYALGWLVVPRPWAGGLALTHAGCNTMNYAVAWLAPGKDFAVLVCANQGDGEAAKACDEAASALIGLH